MNDQTINNHVLSIEAKRLVNQIKREIEQYGGDANDLLHEAVDGHEWVIYTYKAKLLCLECDTTEGEQWLEDIGSEPTNDISALATRVAYATLLTKAQQYI